MISCGSVILSFLLYGHVRLACHQNQNLVLFIPKAACCQQKFPLPISEIIYVIPPWWNYLCHPSLVKLFMSSLPGGIIYVIPPWWDYLCHPSLVKLFMSSLPGGIIYVIPPWWDYESYLY